MNTASPARETTVSTAAGLEPRKGLPPAPPAAHPRRARFAGFAQRVPSGFQSLPRGPWWVCFLVLFFLFPTAPEAQVARPQQVARTNTPTFLSSPFATPGSRFTLDVSQIEGNLAFNDGLQGEQSGFEAGIKMHSAGGLTRFGASVTQLETAFDNNVGHLKTTTELYLGIGFVAARASGAVVGEVVSETLDASAGGSFRARAPNNYVAFHLGLNFRLFGPLHAGFSFSPEATGDETQLTDEIDSPLTNPPSAEEVNFRGDAFVSGVQGRARHTRFGLGYKGEGSRFAAGYDIFIQHEGVEIQAQQIDERTFTLEILLGDTRAVELELTTINRKALVRKNQFLLAPAKGSRLRLDWFFGDNLKEGNLSLFFSSESEVFFDFGDDAADAARQRQAFARIIGLRWTT